jgi:hypothetical protein
MVALDENIQRNYISYKNILCISQLLMSSLMTLYKPRHLLKLVPTRNAFFI